VSLPETITRRRVLEVMRDGGWHAVPIDNEAAGPGTPDVDYCGRYDGRQFDGNVELKRVGAFPKKEGTRFKIPHLTLKQRAWLRKRWDAGGACFLLVQIGVRSTLEYWCMPGINAAMFAGSDPEHGYFTSAKKFKSLCRAPLFGPLTLEWLASALVRAR